MAKVKATVLPFLTVWEKEKRASINKMSLSKWPKEEESLSLACKELITISESPSKEDLVIPTSWAKRTACLPTSVGNMHDATES